MCAKSEKQRKLSFDSFINRNMKPPFQVAQTDVLTYLEGYIHTTHDGSTCIYLLTSAERTC